MGENNSVLTLEHMQWFGLVIQGFARAEHIIQEVLGRLHGARSHSIIMLTVGLTYNGKREALLSSLRAFEMPAKDIEKIRWYLGEIHKHNGLRNFIAHAHWVKGKRQNSVKPNLMKIRGGILELFGFNEKERDYTIPELEALAGELIKTMDQFDAFREKNGYVPLPNKSRTETR